MEKVYQGELNKKQILAHEKAEGIIEDIVLLEDNFLKYGSSECAEKLVLKLEEYRSAGLEINLISDKRTFTSKDKEYILKRKEDVKGYLSGSKKLNSLRKDWKNSY